MKYTSYKILIVLFICLLSSCRSKSANNGEGGGGESITLAATINSPKITLSSDEALLIKSETDVSLSVTDLSVVNGVEKIFSDPDATFNYLKGVIIATNVTRDKLYPIFLLGTIEANESQLLAFSKQLLEAPLGDKPSSTDEYNYYLYSNRLFLNSVESESEILAMLNMLIKNQNISLGLKSRIITEYLIYRPNLNDKILDVVNPSLQDPITK